MARGRYDTRVPALGAGTEVDAVATSFNTMATRLQRTEDTRRRMLSDLAHEMRTPISVLSVYCEALQDGVTHWDEATGELMTDQLGRLTRLVEDIHDVSRAEEGRIELERTAQPVDELLRTAVEAHREAYAAKGVHLVLEAQDASFHGHGDRVGAVIDAELLEDMHQMALDRRFADMQAAGDLAIAVAGGDELEYFDLPPGEGVTGARPDAWR